MSGGFLGWLSRTPVILLFLVLTIFCGFGFYFVVQATGAPLLDEIFSGNEAIARLSAMDEYQRAAHWRGTVFLDTAYPLAYGGFLAGLIGRLSGRYRWFAVLPVLVTMLADFGENAVQAMALGGQPAEVLLAKDILTPLKGGALLASVLLAAVLGIFALSRWFMNRNTEQSND